MKVLETLGPIFLLILLGAALARGRWMTGTDVGRLNLFVYWVALPLLIARELSQAPASFVAARGLLAAFLLATGCCALVAYLLARCLGLRGTRIPTFTQATFRGNLAFVGLPVLLFSFDNPQSPEARAAVGLGLLVFAPTMVTYNVLAVAGFARCHSVDWRATAVQIARNPLILSAGVGVALSWLGGLPIWLDRTADMLGRTSAPLALVCVGGSLALLEIRAGASLAAWAALLKVAVLPLFSWTFGVWLALPADELRILMIFSATPTAVASYVLAQQMGGDEAMAASAVALSTVFSMVALGLIVLLFVPW